MVLKRSWFNLLVLKNIFMHKLARIISLAGIVSVVPACKQSYTDPNSFEATQNTKQAVTVTSLDLTKEPIPIYASGMVASRSEINLSFKIGGIIEQLLVDENQRVKKGQLLAQLRTTEIDAQVLKAKQGVDKANRDVDRIERLYADTAATLEQVQDLSTVLEVAKADLEIAQFNQQYAKIVAPASGRILRKFSEQNELVGSGAPIFQLAANNQKGFILKIGVADRDVIRIKLGDKADIAFDAYPGQVFQANVSEIAEAADPRTGTFEIELTIRANGAALKNGFIGKVTLYPSKQEPYYRIPMDALVEGYANKANIFIPDSTGTRAIKRTIQPTYIGPDFFTVAESQLEGVTAVITGGAAYLKDGGEIEMMASPNLDTAALLMNQ